MGYLYTSWCFHIPLCRLHGAQRRAPLGGHLPLHQEPSASLCGQYQPLPLVLVFMAPCVGHWGVSSAVCPRWAWSHWLASSTCALTLAKSTPRKVTSTSCPCRVAFSVIDTGASGKGAGEACVSAGWLEASAWPLVPALSFFCISAVARFCMPAAMRCLHQPEGALGKSLHSEAIRESTSNVVP